MAESALEPNVRIGPARTLTDTLRIGSFLASYTLAFGALRARALGAFRGSRVQLGNRAFTTTPLWED